MPAFLQARPGMPMADCVARKQNHNRKIWSSWRATSNESSDDEHRIGREEQEDGGMKLYYAPGTISLMPYVALLESGLSFVAVRVDEASKKMADGEDYNAIIPLGYVPALVLDDGSVLIEAAAI